ncbi:hypothetical protein NQ038_09445 [Brevibacterium sp. 50QC2O2]|uniref:hypothetical protein n=1 Tax=Brevibacterium sp. 50QC2O2 TaxID=2968459 RepID=UPI00211BBC9F|nr:hypothetical protein [Brevibacterium sp. 50QC2O2]MCQ9388870.1 hypothetical protein [Brevibacterium sp. 50QC2O2]
MEESILLVARGGDILTYETSTSRVLASVVVTIVLVVFNAIFLMAYRRSPDTRRKSLVTGLSWLTVGAVFIGLVCISGRPLPVIDEEAAEAKLVKKFGIYDVRLVNNDFDPEAAIGDEPTDDSPEFIGKLGVRGDDTGQANPGDYSDAFDYMEVQFRASFADNGNGITNITIIEPAGLKPEDIAWGHSPGR